MYWSATVARLLIVIWSVGCLGFCNLDHSFTCWRNKKRTKKLLFFLAVHCQPLAGSQTNKSKGLKLGFHSNRNPAKWNSFTSFIYKLCLSVFIFLSIVYLIYGDIVQISHIKSKLTYFNESLSAKSRVGHKGYQIWCI